MFAFVIFLISPLLSPTKSVEVSVVCLDTSNAVVKSEPLATPGIKNVAGVPPLSRPVMTLIEVPALLKYTF